MGLVCIMGHSMIVLALALCVTVTQGVHYVLPGIGIAGRFPVRPPPNTMKPVEDDSDDGVGRWLWIPPEENEADSDTEESSELDTEEIPEVETEEASEVASTQGRRRRRVTEPTTKDRRRRGVTDTTAKDRRRRGVTETTAKDRRRRGVTVTTAKDRRRREVTETTAKDRRRRGVTTTKSSTQARRRREACCDPNGEYMCEVGQAEC